MHCALFKDNHPNVAWSLNNVGVAYEKLGKYELALEYVQGALQMYRTQFKGDHPDVAWSLNCLGVAYEKLGKYDKVLEHSQQALQMYRNCF